MTTVAPFPTDPQLTALTIAFRNPDATYIADLVLPRVSVARQEFKWWKYPIEETFAVPDSRVGRRSRTNQVVLSATEQSSVTEDFGLEDAIPQSDIDEAPAGRDPRQRAVMALTDYIMLGREKRVADLVTDAANYPSGYKVTLETSGQWSHADSSPIDAIGDALDVPLMRPNVAVMGRAVWNKLSRHADIVKAVNANSGDKGIATRRAVADLFELDEILVGESRMNTAQKGQAATLTRIWGKHCAFIYRNRMADAANGGVTFGFTAEHGTRRAGAIPDPHIGLDGGQVVKVGERVRELIVAAQAGYLFTDAVA